MDSNIRLVLLSLFVKFIECSHRVQITESDRDLYAANKRIRYVMYHEKLSFNDARTVCQNMGGDLAVIDSQRTLDTILELVDEKYTPNDDFFHDDYWLGLVQVTAGNFLWVMDCSPLSWISNYPTDWKDTELCIKHHKDNHIGNKSPCNNHRAFMCQVIKDEPCMYISRLESESITDNNGVLCQQRCSSLSYCWGTMRIEEIQTCLYLVSPGYGSDSVNLTTKFCMEVDLVTTSTSLPDNDDSKIPNQNCTPVAPLPTSSISIIEPTPSSSTISPPSTVCPTVTVTTTPLPLYVTDFVSVTSNITETVTDFINVTETSTEFVNLTDTVSVTETFTESINITETMYVIITELFNVTITANPTVVNISDEEAEEKAEEITKNLTVDGRTTSAYRRTLMSAEDKRTASQCMGYVGIIVILIPLVILILGDLRTVMKDLRSRVKSRSITGTQLKKR